MAFLDVEVKKIIGENGYYSLLAKMEFKEAIDSGVKRAHAFKKVDEMMEKANQDPFSKPWKVKWWNELRKNRAVDGK